MTIPYHPGIRIVIGYRAATEKPPQNYASEPTEALQKAVRKMGKKWKILASGLVVAPVFGTSEVVVGVSVAKTPRALERAFKIGPNTAISKTHYVTYGSLRGRSIDDFSDDIDGILDAVEKADKAKAFSNMGLKIDLNAELLCWLISDEGHKGALVFGEALWKRGRAYESDEVHTWSHEYDDDEGVRSVNADQCEIAGICG